MLYLGACTGASPPVCVPCGPGLCDDCSAWMVSVKPYGVPLEIEQDYIEYGGVAASVSISFSGKSRGSPCGSGFYLSEVLTFTGFLATFDLSTEFTDLQFCGVRPYIYAAETTPADYASCDDVLDLSGVEVTITDHAVEVSASSITLPTLTYWDGDPPPAEYRMPLRLIFVGMDEGLKRYIVIDLYWDWNGTASEGGTAVYGECRPACPGPEAAYALGYADGVACLSPESPTCSSEAGEAYLLGHADGWIDGACI